MRLSYPSNVKVVKVPCTGRVDVLLMLKAFRAGSTGCTLPGAWRASATTCGEPQGQAQG